MNITVLPDEIKTFIVKHIDSVGKLEVLVLLSKAPDLRWTCARVSRELRSNDTAVSKQLNELASDGLISVEKQSDPLYFFQAKTPELQESLKKLLAFYSTYQMRVIHFIYNRPIHKIQSFADAFRIRKDNSDDS